jgi:hypothetical protein
VLLALCGAVVLASMAYLAYSIFGEFMKRARRPSTSTEKPGSPKKKPTTLRRLLVAGWAFYLVGLILLLVFPKHLLGQGSVATLLALGVVLITVSVIYALVSVGRRRLRPPRQET